VGELHEQELRRRLAALAAEVGAVLEASRQGQLLREGVHVVLAGRPNVGKSSLLNQLAGQELAIVTPVAGTTRDAIRSSVAIDGVPVHLIDTAGLRATTDPVEQIGVGRAWDAIGKADAALLVFDATSGITDADQAIRDALPEGLPCIGVMNKIDLAGLTPGEDTMIGMPIVRISALRGAGIDLLRAAIVGAAGWRNEGDDGGGVYLARERHLVALQLTQELLARAGTVIQNPELAAEELRLAQRALGEITGEYAADDLLGEIFGRFCIGK